MRRADDLTVPAKKFGIEPVRRDRNNDEHEGLAEGLRTLLQNIKANEKALTAKGQPQQEIDDLQELYDQLVADETAQGGALSDQRLLTVDNAELFGALYTLCQEVLADGKTLLVSSRWARRLTVIDTLEKKIVQQIPVGKSPHGVWTLQHAPR